MKPLFILLFYFLIACGSHSTTDETISDPSSPLKADSVKAETFTNPLLPGGPDPWVIHKNGYYFYMNTLGNRLAIRKTKYMADLRNAPLKTVWRPPASGMNVKNIWAPELHYINGNWYIYYTATPAGEGTHHMFVLENTSTDPTTGKWTDKGKIADPAADFFAIDGTVFTYKSRRYFLWSGHASPTDKTQRIYIAQLKNPWTLAGPRVLISSPTHRWEQKGAPPKVNEGPEILKNPDGNIFLIFSASACWTDDYKLGMISLKKGSNPLNAANWSKKNQPVFTKSPAHQAFGPGHNGFFKSPDGSQYWIIYHANPRSAQGCGNDRSPRMQQFYWNDDGTPDFGSPVSLDVSLDVPSRK